LPLPQSALSGNPRHSAVDTANNILEQFGSLRQLLTASRNQYLEQLGIGPVRLVIASPHFFHKLTYHVGPYEMRLAIRCPNEIQYRDRQ